MTFPPDLQTALEAQAQRHGLSLEATVIRLLRLALQAQRARTIGGEQRAARLTPEQRSAIARSGGKAPRKPRG